MAGFALVKWGSSHWDWDLVTGNWGKNVKNQEWEWDLRNAKWDLEKNELGNGIGTPASGPSVNIVTRGSTSQLSGSISFSFFFFLFSSCRD